MPYNPYGPGGPLFRAAVATPTNSQDAELRAAHAAVSAADRARDKVRDTSPQRPVQYVHLASESSRGRRYIVTGSGDFVLARPGVGVWEVYPCGPRGGVSDSAPRLGRGSTPQDALEDAGYREVVR